MEEQYDPITAEMRKIYSEARTIAGNAHGNGFEYIKDTFLEAMKADPNTEELVKTAIMLAAEKLERFNSGPLLGVLTIKWEDIGPSSETVTALDPARREQVLQGILQVCRGVIAAEAQRLMAVASAETPLDADWYERLNPPVVEEPVEPAPSTRR